MIHSRAKPHRVAKALDLLDGADTMICNAALCNVLTDSQDQRIRDLARLVRIFRAGLEEAAMKKWPEKFMEDET